MKTQYFKYGKIGYLDILFYSVIAIFVFFMVFMFTNRGQDKDLISEQSESKKESKDYVDNTGRQNQGLAINRMNDAGQQNQDPAILNNNNWKQMPSSHIKVVKTSTAKVPYKKTDVILSGPVNVQYGTPMPIYKDNMIDMLSKEADQGSPGALTKDQVKQLKESGNLIY